MSVKVFYIPLHRKGSTETLFRTAIENISGPDYSSILYISPSPRKLSDSYRIFHRLVGGCYIPPDMFTFRQLSKTLYSLYESKKIIPDSLIPVILSRVSSRGIGFSAMISHFIAEIKQYHAYKDFESVSRELISILEELGIPEEIKKRAQEASDIFRTYQELLHTSSVIDENDVLAYCPELIIAHPRKWHTVIIDGFYDITHLEEEIIKAITEKADNTLISIPYHKYIYISDKFIYFLNNNFKFDAYYIPEEDSGVEPIFYSFPGLEEEIEGIARHIKNSFIAGSIKDLDNVIVTFPLPGKYAERVSRIFKKYGIPHCLCGSRKPGLMKPFLDIIALLESVSDDYPRLRFSQFLVSPYFRNLHRSFKIYIPRLSIVSGITKGKDSWLSLFDPAHYTPDEAFMNSIRKSELAQELKRLFKLFEPLESLKERGEFRQYSERILDLLQKLGFSASGQEEDDFEEYISRFLQEIAFVDDITASSETPLTLRSFIDFLKYVLNSSQLEREDTGVKVMGFPELHGLEPEYLYIGGLTDGDLPAKPDIDHILPDSVRTRFGLFNLDKYLLLQKFVFFRIMGSADKLHLSYPSMEGDRLFLPSPYLPWNREICQRRFGIFSREEELIMKGKNPLTSFLSEIADLEKKAIDHTFGETIPMRVTTVDSYRTCPRKFFIEKVLGLEPLEIKKYEVEATILGTIMHEIMQKVISMPFESLDDLAAIADQVTDKFLIDQPVEEYWKKVIRDTFLSMIPVLHKIEKKIRADGYVFSEAESSVSGEIIKGVMLKGKIDRIDRKIRETEDNTRFNAVAELIDYKTGTMQLSGPQVLTKGASLQLFLYAALMKTRGVTVERVGVYSLKDMQVSWIPGRNDRKEGRTIEDYITASLDFLMETVSRMRKGNFHATPLNDQTCRNCPESPYCPYVQKTVAVNV